MLGVIWDTSIILALGSLGVMLFLILRRVLSSRKTEEAALERRKLLKALIAFSDNNDRAAIKKHLTSASPQAALEACFEFLTLLRGDEYDEVVSVLREANMGKTIARQLRCGNEANRLHAAEMLAVINPPEAVAGLTAALEGDRSREVRIAASIALADIDALPPLETVLRLIGPDGQRSRRIVELFRHLPADRFDEVRNYMGRPHVSPLVRAAAIESLSQTSDNDVIILLEQAAGDPAPEVSAAAVRAIARLSIPDPQPVLAKVLSRADWQIRLEAANAIGKLGLVEFVDELGIMLDDDAWSSRYAAGKALRQLGPRGLAKLNTLSNGKSSRVQRTASIVLAEERKR